MKLMKQHGRSLAIFFIAIFLSKIDKTDATIYAYDEFNETDTFTDLESSFGPAINSDGMVGLLIRAEPYDGCKVLKPPPFTPGGNPENITISCYALIKRGGCDFGLKVFNAQLAGYQAVIVHNVDSDILVRMSSAFPSITNEIVIPSVFVSESSAVRLNVSFLYDKKGNPYIQLYEGSFNPLDYYLVPFIVVIAVCFVSLLCFMLIKCMRDRRRTRRGRLSLQRLKKLPVKKFDKGDEYDCCAICLEDYEEGDILRILPCNHAYHCKCVDPWLTSSKRICPLCKRRVISDDESSSSSDDADDSSEDERTPLVRSSVASSPNSPMFATGYGTRNPIARASHRRTRSHESNSSSDTSTDVSEIVPILARVRGVKNPSHGLGDTDIAQPSGYQSQQLTTSAEPDVNITSGMMNPAMEPDDYLNSAEVMMTGPRVSESSIAVLSDIEQYGSTPEPHSYSSQDFHSLDESISIAQSPPTTIQHDEDSDSVSDGIDQDDIVVIAQGSKISMVCEDDSEV